VQSSIDVTFGQLAGALALIAVAVAVSIWWKADLEGDIVVAVVRSFIQLTAVGYVITFIFEQNTAILVVALLVGMVLFGTFTARHRARKVPHSFWPLLAALSLAGGV